MVKTLLKVTLIALGQSLWFWSGCVSLGAKPTFQLTQPWCCVFYTQVPSSLPFLTTCDCPIPMAWWWSLTSGNYILICLWDRNQTSLSNLKLPNHPRKIFFFLIKFSLLIFLPVFAFFSNNLIPTFLSPKGSCGIGTHNTCQNLELLFPLSPFCLSVHLGTGWQMGTF